MKTIYRIEYSYTPNDEWEEGLISTVKSVSNFEAAKAIARVLCQDERAEQIGCSNDVGKIEELDTGDDKCPGYGFEADGDNYSFIVRTEYLTETYEEFMAQRAMEIEDRRIRDIALTAMCDYENKTGSYPFPIVHLAYAVSEFGSHITVDFWDERDLSKRYQCQYDEGKLIWVRSWDRVENGKCDPKSCHIYYTD